MIRLFSSVVVAFVALGGLVPGVSAEAKKAVAPAATAPAAPAPTTTDFLDAVPENAIAFASVRNGKELNDKLMRLLQQLGVAAILPLPPPLEMFKDFSGLGDGYVDAGPIGLAVLSCESLDELSNRLAIYLPCNNVETMIENMGATEMEGGMWQINFFDWDTVVGKKGKFAVLSASAETVKKIVGDTSKLTAKVTGERLKAYRSDDVFVWIDVAGAMPLVKPFLDQMTEEIQANPETQQMAGLFEMAAKYIGDTKTVQAGLGLDAVGLKLHLYFEAKAESELAAIMAAQKATDKSLLVGLPKEKFIIAAGQTVAKEASQIGLKHWDAVFEMEQVKAMVDGEKLEAFRKDLEALQLQGSAYSLCVSVLPEGPDGLVGVAFVATCDDSAKWVAALDGLITNGKAMIVDEEVKAVTDLLELKKDAEKVGETSVHHLTVDLEKAETISAETLETVNKIVGQEGVLFRIAAAGPKHAVVVFGGGKGRFEKVLKLAAAGEAPLGADAGIQRVTKKLPKKRAAEFYIALDAAGQLAKSILTIYGMGEFIPFPIPDVNAPIAIVVSTGPTHQEMNLFVPMELVIAIKDVALNAMGGMMMQQEAPAQP